MNIFWTDEAINDLRNIYDYYYFEASPEVAEKMMNDLLEATLPLVAQPGVGQKESLLAERKSDYRYLVNGNYKIIYWLENNYIYIAAVFDCRQSPDKMKTI